MLSPQRRHVNHQSTPERRHFVHPDLDFTPQLSFLKEVIWAIIIMNNGCKHCSVMMGFYLQCQMEYCRSHHPCNQQDSSLSCFPETDKGSREESRLSDINPPWSMWQYSSRFLKLPEGRWQIEKNGLNNSIETGSSGENSNKCLQSYLTNDKEFRALRVITNTATLPVPMHFSSDKWCTSYFYICLWQQALRFVLAQENIQYREVAVYISNAFSRPGPSLCLSSPKEAADLMWQVVPNVLKPNEPHVSSNLWPLTELREKDLLHHWLPSMSSFPTRPGILSAETDSLSHFLHGVSAAHWLLPGIITKWGWI